MKGMVIFLLASLSLNSAGYKTYKMDGNIFRCLIPSDWKIERDAEKDKKDKIYKVFFVNPQDSRILVAIKYYSVDSGKKYEDFIEINSKTADGKLEGPNEKYEPVKNINILDRKAFEINRLFKEFVSIEAGSEQYWLKERIIVIPAKKGFYTITYSSPEKSFSKYKNIFDNIVKSFRPLY